MSTTHRQINERPRPVLEAWIEAMERNVPTETQRRDFSRFLDWCRFYDLPTPANGDDVAAYLMEMLADGATLAALKRAAESIGVYYKHRRYFLDWIPVEAALALAGD